MASASASCSAASRHGDTSGPPPRRPITAIDHFLWIFATLFPILVWGAAFSIGYRRAAHELFLIMLTGLALVAVFWLNVVAYSTLNTASLIG